MRLNDIDAGEIADGQHDQPENLTGLQHSEAIGDREQCHHSHEQALQQRHPDHQRFAFDVIAHPDRNDLPERTK